MADEPNSPENRTPLPRWAWVTAAVLVVTLVGALAWWSTSADKSAVPDVPESDQIAESKTEVPDVVGLTKADATAALDAAGLATSETAEYDPLVAAGSVIDQLPAAGDKVEPGATVGILVSLGKRPAQQVRVPNVVGQTQNEAQERLRDAGLGAYFTLTYDPAVPVGTVIEQEPGPRARVEPDSTVLLAVSIGPEQPAAIAVPDVVGLRRAAAMSALTEAGLRGQAIEMYSDRPKGEVVAQEPREGVKVAPGSRIGVHVSAGRRPSVPPATPPTYPDPPPGDEPPPVEPDVETTSVPRVIGMSAEDAMAKMLDAGLRPTLIPTPNEDHPEGTVFEQSPDAEEIVYKGYAVMLLVSEGAAPDEPSDAPTDEPTDTPADELTDTP